LIVESRIGRSVVHPRTLEFLSKKVASTSGDVRKVFELVSKAIDLCRDKLPHHILDGDLRLPVVTLAHAMMAIRESNVEYSTLVVSLPTYEKATLCAGVNLSRVLGNKPLTLGLLRRYSFLLLNIDPYGDDFVSIEDFKGIVERLYDWGLLKLVDFDSFSFSNLSMSRSSSIQIRFDQQLEDVESALEESLSQNKLYKMMADKVKVLFVNL
jgi:Cdc6-like AAA superfamily ATPase